MRKRWLRKQTEAIQTESAALQEDHQNLKSLIHDVSDVVIELRVATENLESALREMEKREEARNDDAAD